MRSCQKSGHQETTKHQMRHCQQNPDQILCYFVHVKRMEPYRLPHQALYARLHGTRTPGRPELCWVDNIAADVSKLTIVEQSTERETDISEDEDTRGCPSM